MMILDMSAAAWAPILAVAIDVDGTILVQMGAFLFTLFMLHTLLLKPYLKTMDARQESVGGSEEEAGEMQAQAAILESKYDQDMLTARRDAQQVRESFREQGQTEQEEILAEVRRELQAKLEQERAAIADRVEAATRELSQQADQLADSMVNRLIPN